MESPIQIEPSGPREPAASYQPGVCNIGPEEVRMRRRSGYAGLAVSAVLAGGLLVSRAPRPARLLVALPLTGGVVGLLQARERFCVNFGTRGVYNFGPRGVESAVVGSADRRADLGRSGSIIARSLLVGVGGAAALLLLPG